MRVRLRFFAALRERMGARAERSVEPGARRAERRAGNDGRRTLARAGRGASGAGRDARALRRERDLRRALAPAGRRWRGGLLPARERGSL